MSNINPTNFPDQEYFKNLVEQMDAKVKSWQDETTRLLMLSGASMNWIGDYFSDPAISWAKETLNIDDLYLTGMNPGLNTIILDKAERSPQKLRQLMESNPEIKKNFENFKASSLPILVREDEGKLKVFDGMHRVVVAIRDGKTELQAFVARPSGKIGPQCEPHVVYDLLRGYQRGNKDRSGLIAALKFLKTSYSNVEDLLKNRFNTNWIPDEEIQSIIGEVIHS